MNKKLNWLLGGAASALGLTLGFTSLINQNFLTPVGNHNFVTQSVSYKKGMGIPRGGTGSTGGAGYCGDGMLSYPEQCEYDYQCNRVGSKDYACIACACELTGNVETGSIDLSLQKELISSNSSVYKYRITVRNNGSLNASNFTVKDYLPANGVFTYASNGGIHNQGMVTWNIASLDALQSISLVVELKRSNDKELTNKTEICNYEKLGDPIDQDSDSCNMGPSGVPHEDDESMVTAGSSGSTGNVNTGSNNTGVTVSCTTNYYVLSNNPTSVLIYTLVYDQNGNLIGNNRPIGYSYYPQAWLNGPANFVIPTVDGQGVVNNVPYGYYTASSALIGPNGQLISCTPVSFEVRDGGLGTGTNGTGGSGGRH